MIPNPPAAWVPYSCTLLESYGNNKSLILLEFLKLYELNLFVLYILPASYDGASKRVFKLQQDNKALQSSLKRAKEKCEKVDELPTKKARCNLLETANEEINAPIRELPPFQSLDNTLWVSSKNQKVRVLNQGNS